MSREPGDIVRITPPFGWFRPGQDVEEAPFVFLATGTGIAPFLSYIKTFSNPPVRCLYGVRRAADAIGYEELQLHCPTHLAVSREQTDEHHQGRITELLELLPLDAGTHYYCCGLESMVNEVSEWLQQNGIGLSQIHREVFFHG
jgi:ferredoxin-NADP reductase